MKTAVRNTCFFVIIDVPYCNGHPYCVLACNNARRIQQDQDETPLHICLWFYKYHKCSVQGTVYSLNCPRTALSTNNGTQKCTFTKYLFYKNVFALLTELIKTKYISVSKSFQDFWSVCVTWLADKLWAVRGCVIWGQICRSSHLSNPCLRPKLLPPAFQPSNLLLWSTHMTRMHGST